MGDRSIEPHSTAIPSEPIPIALVITELDPGGAERALVALAKRLDRRFWNPKVIGLGAEGVLAEDLRKSGISTECLGGSPRKPLQMFLRLKKALQAHRPKLIQAFLFHANIAARLAKPFVGHPIVVSGLRVAEHGKRWHAQVDRWTSAWSAGWVCVSQGVERHAVRVAGLPEDRLIVIPNGVDHLGISQAPIVSRESLNLSESDLVALFVGRIDRQKGWPILLEAFRQIANRVPHLHLRIVGDGPERDQLRLAIDQLGDFQKRVVWLGQRNDVPGLLKMSDILVSTSLWEGMPNVILEAMAAGKAVIATDVEGSQELVTPGETGWLTQPGDVQSLCEVWLDALSDRDRLRRYGERARQEILNHYDWDRTASAYHDYWLRLLNKIPSMR